MPYRLGLFLQDDTPAPPAPPAPPLPVFFLTLSPSLGVCGRPTEGKLVNLAKGGEGGRGGVNENEWGECFIVYTAHLLS